MLIIGGTFPNDRLFATHHSSSELIISTLGQMGQEWQMGTITREEFFDEYLRQI